MRGMVQWRTLTLAGLCAPLLWSCGGQGATPEPPDPSGREVPAAAATSGAASRAEIDSLLTFASVENILAGQAEAFSNQLDRMALDLPPETRRRVDEAVQAELTPEALYEDLARHLRERAPEGRVPELLALLGQGASAEIDRVMEGYEPPQSFEEFVVGFDESPPEQERLEAVVRWATSQSAGDFYVVLSEVIRRGAHRVAAAVTDAPAYDAMEEGGYAALRRRAFNGAVVSFLHRFQPVSDSLILASAREYETEAGSWFVESYTLGMAEAILAGADRVARRVAGEDQGGS